MKVLNHPELKFSVEAQSAAILKDLQAGRRLTPLDALKRYGCLRLGARIWDLRHAGHNITTTMVKVGDGKMVAEYRLVK